MATTARACPSFSDKVTIATVSGTRMGGELSSPFADFSEGLRPDQTIEERFSMPLEAIQGPVRGRAGQGGMHPKAGHGPRPHPSLAITPRPTHARKEFFFMSTTGTRIQSYRERQKLSIDDLAERTGLSPEFIKAVEEDDMYPSLQPLVKLARALGVRLGTFLDDQVSSDPLVVRLSQREQELTMHHDGKEPGVVFHSLGRGKTDRHMEPFFIELLPNSGHDETLSSHEGEEFIVVQSGQMRIRYGQEESILSAGDSVYFNSVVPHNVACAGGQKAEIYAVLYFPE
jgi:transcriptional regulator with XRE-family HTH domain